MTSHKASRHQSTARYIQKALKENFMCADGAFSLYKSDQEGETRNHTIIVGKKALAKAVDRNLIRRRTQEVLRTQTLPQHTHITLLYRGKKLLSTSEISKSITTLLQKI